MSARRNRAQLRGNAAKVIRDARTYGNVSQVRMAELLGISQPLVSSWECGKVTPGLDDLARIEQVLGVDKGSLFVAICYEQA